MTACIERRACHVVLVFLCLSCCACLLVLVFLCLSCCACLVVLVLLCLSCCVILMYRAWLACKGYSEEVAGVLELGV